MGISESVNTNHEDLIGQSDILNGNSSSSNGHGTSVSLFAGGKTDNNVGISSIGFNNFIRGKSGGASAVIQLAQNGVKVINMSWGFCTLSQNATQIYEAAMNEAYSNGAVLVAAAGNGAFSCNLGAEAYHYPAANDKVIAVTVVGHLYELNDSNPLHNNQKDRFEAVGNVYPFTTYNDSVDVAAPGRHVLTQVVGQSTGNYGYSGGTSYAAPIVTGTIGLMFDVNYCLTQKEVETIIKLSSRKVDNLTVNQAFYGKIGSGVLDAYEAVKMAKDMADDFGTVEVKDRVLYRPWFYKLVTAPYKIKMTNNDVTGGSKLKFKARNNIEILSGDYYPESGGYIDLSIDETLALDCPPPPINSANTSRKVKTKINESQGKNLVGNYGLSIFPNPTTGILNITNKEDLNAISISDITGKTVYSVKEVNAKELKINMSKFNSGMYFVEIKMKTGAIHTQKMIKK
ncbi:hypothetical protein A8C32_07275 [Flavivirga aquatica]|uniref:Secretion system C-terminal sorting domain-containing protein n=1 Tax=Flavivirga aquatica TaxID=1849968 RepID=A0A1E5SIT2_9FLAO|nr:S8/S53 family peptidase [Flavivirga aquatica]OEJ98976.1 hypothetical protein A8C32_07275 [Flavivirga aquatica]